MPELSYIINYAAGYLDQGEVPPEVDSLGLSLEEIKNLATTILDIAEDEIDTAEQILELLRDSVAKAFSLGVIVAHSATLEEATGVSIPLDADDFQEMVVAALRNGRLTFTIAEGE